MEDVSNDHGDCGTTGPGEFRGLVVSADPIPNWAEVRFMWMVASRLNFYHVIDSREINVLRRIETI